MDLGISGKIALVTASSAGIGFACANALATEGVTVCLTSRNKDNLERAAEKIKSDVQGANVHTFVCDMRDTAGVKELCSGVKAEVGSPDILVNNTGGPKPGGFFDLTLDDWEESYRLLVASTVALYQQLIPDMREKGWGRIVNVTSISSRQPVPGLILSNSFRPGLLGLTKTVADDVGADGVLLMTVMPGVTMTARMKQLSEARGEESIVSHLLKQIPVKRAADPKELGNVVAFLCSEKSSFMTGSTIAIDGGSLRAL